ncbi:hypothetical protein HAALTHF_15550n [Vreelandella aquamarina]|nr:hypothetical protein HAALTHF_15550n [Halomonas axialensis]
MTETCPIHYWAQQTPEHIAVEAGAVRLSYRTLNRRVASLAQQLARQGLMPGMPLWFPPEGRCRACCWPGPACGQGWCSAR